MLILLFGTAILSLPPVQTFLANKAAGYLKTAYDVELTIEGVQIILPNKVILTNVYIPDQHQDTLIFATEIDFTFRSFSGEMNRLEAGHIGLRKAKLYLRKLPEDSVYNFLTFTNKFASENPDTTGPEFSMYASRIEVEHMQFQKRPVGCDSCTVLDWRNCNLDVSDFRLDDGEYVTATIHQMQYEDPQRFNLKRFKAKAAYQSHFMELEDLEFTTTESQVEGNARLDYSGIDDFDDFLNKVSIQAEFVESRLQSDEFRSFLTQYPDLGLVKIDGKASGPVNDLKTENITIEYGERTSFFGSVDLENVTEVENIYLDGNIGYFRTERNEANSLYKALFGNDIPGIFPSLTKLSMTGHYTGSLESFEARGRIETNLGDFSTDVILHNLDDPSRATYDGNLSMNGFDLGRMISEETLGKVSLKGTVKGRSFLPESAEADLDVEVRQVEFMNYNYQNLVIDGEAANGAFNGIVSIKDPNLDLDFDGDFVMVKDSNQFDFNAAINHWDLFATHFSDDSISVVTTKLDVDFTGKDLNNYSGTIRVEEATYESGMRFYFFNEILIRNRLQGEQRALNIESELLTASLKGNYDLIEIPSQLDRYFKSQFLKPDEIPQDELQPEVAMNYDLRVDMNNTELLTEILLPKLYIEPNTVLTSHYNSPTREFQADLVSPGFSFGANQFMDFSISLSGGDKKFHFMADFDPFVLANRIEGDSILLTGEIFNDSIQFEFNTILKDSIDTYYSMDGRLTLDPDKVNLAIDTGYFNIGLDQFSYPSHDRISFYGDSIQFKDFTIVQNNMGELNLDGVMGKEDDRMITARFNDFGLSLFSYLIRDPSANFKGKLSGDLYLRSILGDLRFSSDLTIDSLNFNGEHQGKFFISSQWASASDLIETTIKAERGSLKTLEFHGTVDPSNDFALDLKANFDRFRIRPFNPFVDYIFSNLRGAVSGSARVTGTAFKPIVNGSLTLNNAGFTVSYIGTDYNFEGTPNVTFTENNIQFDKVTIRDTKESTSGSVSGSIRHNYFSDLVLDIHIRANGLLCLDLDEGGNEYFYGRAFGTGTVDIVGPTENISVNVNATTDRGTDLKIPMSNPTEVVEKGFITFVSPYGDDEQNKDNRALVDLGLAGLSLNLNINVTPDARVELIMDETVGDVISGSGEGNLRISIPPNGEMEMYGSLEVVKGEYLFTLQNLINKPFTIRSGGDITWTGDPFKARMNLVARYTTRTSLNGVVRNQDYMNERYTVNLDLALQGQLLNPNINFDISVPGAPPAVQEELRSALNDQNKLNYQAFSLLAFNTFAPDNEAAANSLVGYGVQSNGMQMVVSQFSNFINQGLNGVVDVQLAYNQGGIPNTTTGATSQEQLEVGLSKSFIDDRLIVNGVLDVPVGSNPNALVGDVELEYRITPNVRAKAFNRSNQDNPALDKLAPYTQGVGIFYRTDFNTFGELVRKIFGIKEEEEPQPQPAQESPSDSTSTAN